MAIKLVTGSPSEGMSFAHLCSRCGGMRNAVFVRGGLNVCSGCMEAECKAAAKAVAPSHRRSRMRYGWPFLSRR